MGVSLSELRGLLLVIPVQNVALLRKKEPMELSRANVLCVWPFIHYDDHDLGRKLSVCVCGGGMMFHVVHILIPEGKTECWEIKANIN